MTGEIPEEEEEDEEESNEYYDDVGVDAAIDEDLYEELPGLAALLPSIYTVPNYL